MAHFRLVLPRFPWCEALRELTWCYGNALEAAGHTVVYADTYEYGQDYRVAFGAHVVPPPPTVSVVMQSEHHAHWFTSEYMAVLHRTPHVVNMGPFQLDRHLRTLEVPPGVMTRAEVGKFSHIHDSGRDIDVLHYGSITPRRARVLEALTSAGVQVVALYGVLGAERDAYIDRAKIVLDLKQQGDEPDDQTRVFWALSRGACVLSENAPTDLPRCRITAERVVDHVRSALSSEHEQCRLHEAYTARLGRCDVSPLLRALGL